MAKAAKKTRGVLEYPPGSGKWFARWYEDGKEFRLPAKTKGEALSIYEDKQSEKRKKKLYPELEKEKTRIEQEKAKLENLQSSRPTLRELADSYLKQSKVQNVRANEDETRAKSWTEAVLQGKDGAITLGDVVAEEVSTDQINEVILELSKEFAPATVHRRLTILKAIYSKGERDGKISRNPVRLAKAPKYNNEVNRYLSLDEERRLFAVLPSLYVPIVTTALHTGARAGELLGLQWQEIDLEARRLYIKTGRKSKPRGIPLNSILYETLKNEFEARKPEPTDKVFPVGHAKSLSRAFKTAVDRAKIQNFRFHDLRHTFNSRLAMNGANDRVLMTLSGWSSERMIRRYTHLSPEYLEEAVEGLTKPKLRVAASNPQKRANRIKTV